MRILAALMALPLALAACRDSTPESAAPAPVPNVELEADLGLADVSVVFDRTPLAEAVDFLAQAAGVDIRLHPSAIEGRSEQDLLVDHDARDVSVASALAAVAASKGLEIRYGEDFVELVRPPASPQGNVIELYDVRDLGAEEDVMDLLQKETEGAWKGDASIELRDGGVLIVKAPPAVQKQVRAALEDLRTAGR